MLTLVLRMRRISCLCQPFNGLVCAKVEPKSHQLIINMLNQHFGLTNGELAIICVVGLVA